MFLTKSPFSSPAIANIKGIKGLSCEKSKICDGEKRIQPSRRITWQSSKVKATLTNGYEAINKEYLEMPLKEEYPIKGIGITKFFQGKNIFLTGGTGLLGKALVEKVLRSTPVGKIYILVKADDSETATDRLAKELVDSELFGRVQEKHEKYYQEFIKEKLIPVVGNICEPNLGMDSDSSRAIMEDVNVIIESAAITTMNERYDLLLEANVNGPQRLMRFAKTCKNLELLVHISTAFVNGEREGIILEKPLMKGGNRGYEVNGEALFQRLDIGDEINLALRSCKASSNYDVTKDMKKLGMERSRFYGWCNTYQLTKAMAEMVINETRGDIPVIVIRPSVIESCYQEPYPGWIQGNRMFDPIIVSYGKGQLPAFLGNPNSHMDIIPLDMVVNATIAAIAKHGNTNKPELNVYQLASGLTNPLRWSEFFEYIYEYFSSEPLIGSEHFNRINFFENFDDFSKYTRQDIFERHGLRDAVGDGGKKDQRKLQKQCRAKVAYAENLCRLYEFVGSFKAWFHSGNMEKLLSEMSKEEKKSFAIDVKKINWKKYLQEVHIPGVRKYVLNDKRISI